MIVKIKAGKCKNKCIPPERRIESATTGMENEKGHGVNIGILGYFYSSLLTSYFLPLISAP